MPPALPVLQVLLVDDDPLVRRALARALRRQGCDVVEVAGGADAIAALSARTFDLVLSDFDLGGRIDGLDVLEHARLASPATVRALGTGSIDARFAASIASGLIDRFLSKPMSTQDLLDLLGLVRSRRP